MGVEYILVNATKQEVVSFSHLNGSKKRELAGGCVQSAIVTWYLLENCGDQIQFVSDTYNDWPFEKGNKRTPSAYKDMTNAVISTLIDQKILKDNGMLFVDEDNPETSYIRNIENIWDK